MAMIEYPRYRRVAQELYSYRNHVIPEKTGIRKF